MGRRASVIELTDEEREYLETQARARTTQAQTVARARILLLKADGRPVDEIADKVGLNRKSVMLCLSKYREGGVENAWVVDLACRRPADLGYAAETWTYALLTSHIHEVAEAARHTRLSTVHKSTVHRILDEAEVKPLGIRHYCERRDPEFDERTRNVLLVYKQLSMHLDEDGNLVPQDGGEVVDVLSFDEKPGIQAVSTTSGDLIPDADHGTCMRDYEYRRRGTLSLLAGIDLQTGEAIPLAGETHNSGDYVAFLKILDAKYPKGDKIRLVSDDLRVHTSQETRRYLATVPGRFEFVFTPKHGSWPDTVEGFLSKMTRQTLGGIRVESKEELKERIYRYFEEVNREPVVYRWKYRLDEVDVSEDVVVDTLPLKQSS